MMLQPVTLAKLGGSLITNKKKCRSSRALVIKRISSEIKRAIHFLGRTSSDGKVGHKVIIGNGSGSFGHPSAAKYKTAQGFTKQLRKSRYGYCVVQNDASEINRIILKSLLSLKLPAVSVQPSALVRLDNGKIQQKSFLSLQIIEAFLETL